MHRNMVVGAETAHRLDVVGMVVSKNDIVNLVHRQRIVSKLLAQHAYPDAQVDNQTIVVGE